MSIPPNAMYTVNASPPKIPMVFFHRNRAKPPNICVEPQRTPNSQGDTEKGEQAGGTSLPDFTLPV